MSEFNFLKEANAILVRARNGWIVTWNKCCTEGEAPDSEHEIHRLAGIVITTRKHDSKVIDQMLRLKLLKTNGNGAFLVTQKGNQFWAKNNPIYYGKGFFMSGDNDKEWQKNN